MEFCEKILQHIQQNNLIHIIDNLKNVQVAIWGTGQAGEMIFYSLKRNGINPCYFVDSNSDLIGKTYCTVPIIGVDDIKKTDYIVIAANINYRLHECLEIMGISYVYIDPISLWEYDGDNPYYVRNEISNHQKEINMVFNMLNDEHSKEVYYKVLLHRATHNISLIWDIYDHNQYFGNEIVANISGNFVDCGAYQGDTLLQFVNQVGEKEYKYFAFEADINNFIKLSNLIKAKKWNAFAYNLGVWDTKEVLCFQNDVISGVGVSGKVVKSENEDYKTIKVNADSLDHVLEKEKVDFIKMDIEGAEIRALYGASTIIKLQEPVLAISAYHELNHLWEIPLLIKKLNKKYQIQFAHHMWNMADTVCYAIPRSPYEM
ncbi:methyltransferase FkbM family [Firmicutes bacterium CAG:95]|nr:methyltransferase FkbM family [Firmicutes bacterium CAG:95]